MEQQFDNLLLGQLNRRMNRYRHFTASGRLDKETLWKIRDWDIDFIWSECAKKDYDARPYLKYYTTRI